MSWSDDEIRGKILHKLVRAGKFEHSRTAIEHMQKGFPKDLVGRVKDNIQKLAKEGILKIKPTNYGMQVSVNVDRTDEVIYYVEIFLKKV